MEAVACAWLSAGLSRSSDVKAPTVVVPFLGTVVADLGPRQEGLRKESAFSISVERFEDVAQVVQVVHAALGALCSLTRGVSPDHLTVTRCPWSPRRSISW